MTIKKCFTINPFRTEEEIRAYYRELIEPGFYQACEFFYPYQLSDERANIYTNALKDLFSLKYLEKVLHLPYGKDNNIATRINIEKTMERLIKALDYANLFDIKKLTIHPGELAGDLAKEDAFCASIKNMRVLANYASKYGMVLMVENLIGANELCVSADEMLDYLQEVNHPNVMVTFDTGHAHVARQDIPDYIYKLKDYLHHLHLSDNDQMRDAHASLGTGTIDFYAVLKALNDISYKELFCAEVIHQKGKELIPMAKSLDEIAWRLKNA